MHLNRNLIVEYIDIQRLHPYPRNARTHSKKQIRQIADSIKTFGFTNPILIDQELTVLCGHGRLAGAKLLGMQSVPCVRLSSMTTAQKRAYVLADNKLALNAGWDEEILAIELEALSVPDLDFSVEVTGFSIPEIETLIDGIRPQDQGDPADAMFVVLEGQLQGRGEFGGETFFFTSKTGDIVGVLPFSRMKHYTVSGRALTDSRLMRFPAALFPQLVQKMPDLTQRLVNLMSDRIREATRVEQQRDRLAGGLRGTRRAFFLERHPARNRLC
jgi:CRP-like cAMP-binding protein